MSECLCEGGEARICGGIGGRGRGEGMVKEDGHQRRGMEGSERTSHHK